MSEFLTEWWSEEELGLPPPHSRIEYRPPSNKPIYPLFDAELFFSDGELVPCLIEDISVDSKVDVQPISTMGSQMKIVQASTLSTTLKVIFQVDLIEINANPKRFGFWGEGPMMIRSAGSRYTFIPSDLQSSHDLSARRRVFTIAGEVTDVTFEE